jgi:hypothetical protein
LPFFHLIAIEFIQADSLPPVKLFNQNALFFLHKFPSSIWLLKGPQVSVEMNQAGMDPNESRLALDDFELYIKLITWFPGM